MTMRRFARIAAMLFGLVAAAASVSAQQYPSRTVTIVVPYPAGGPTDETARVVGQFLSTRLKKSFIVQDITGGETIVATEKVARATPDGYMLLLHNLQISANVTLYKHLPFDTVKDFAPVMLINRNPLVLVGRPTLAANTLAELVALMKKERLKAAIPGYGSTGHLATTLLAQEAGAKLDQIPYRGAAPAITDLFSRPGRSVLRHAAIGGAARCHREAEGLRRHFEGQTAGVSECGKLRDHVRAETRLCLLAGAVRSGQNARAGD